MPMGRLTRVDDGLHEPGPDGDWSESRYVDVFDPRGNVALWLRLGCRPNQHVADVSVCVHLPDGSVAVGFERVELQEHATAASGMQWDIIEPFALTRVRYEGVLTVLADPWSLTDPGPALRAGAKVD